MYPTLAQPAGIVRAHCTMSQRTPGRIPRCAACAMSSRPNALLRVVSQAYSVVSWHLLCRIAAVSRALSPHKAASLSHDTVFCIATLPSKAMRARAASRPARRSAVSWPSDGRIVALGCATMPTVSRYNSFGS